MKRTPYEMELERRIADLEARVPLVKASTWVAPTLINGWSNYGGALQVAGYCRDSSGFWHTRGLVKRAAALVPHDITEAFFILPVEARPPKEMTFAQVGFNKFVRLVIATTGHIYCAANDAAAPETFISLDGITWDARP